MTVPFHVMPFEKRFLKKRFSPQISLKPPSPQETEHRKKEKKKKRKKKKEKKAPRVSSNKRRSQYFERRKTLQLQRSFFM
jgi:predicted ribosome quality control (RQC) complex YloA/Tae2 family protein